MPTKSPPRASWLTPTLLLALTLVPAAAGVARLVWLATGEVRPDAARWAAGPAPLVVHIVCALLFAGLGAFQFVPALRRRWSAWHRLGGRVAALAGMGAALSGLWITLLYPPGAGDGEVVFGLRLLFGSAMLACLALGVLAILRRDVRAHEAWMLRGYAIGMGAGTQVLTHLPWLLLVGAPDEAARAALMGAGWVINVIVAEWLIRRPLWAAPPRAMRLAVAA